MLLLPQLGIQRSLPRRALGNLHNFVAFVACSMAELVLVAGTSGRRKCSRHAQSCGTTQVTKSPCVFVLHIAGALGCCYYVFTFARCFLGLLLRLDVGRTDLRVNRAWGCASAVSPYLP